MKIETAKAIQLFNQKASKGIKFLLSSKTIMNEKTPKEIAIFLASNKEIDHEQLGECIGNYIEYNI